MAFQGPTGPTGFNGLMGPTGYIGQTGYQGSASSAPTGPTGAGSAYFGVTGTVSMTGPLTIDLGYQVENLAQQMVCLTLLTSFGAITDSASPFISASNFNPYPPPRDLYFPMVVLNNNVSVRGTICIFASGQIEIWLGDQDNFTTGVIGWRSTEFFYNLH